MDGAEVQDLRRGRGAGYLAALAGGTGASSDVLECVVHDPRWDRQIESRGDHYARLLLVLDADLAPVVEAVARVAAGDTADASDGWLPVDVLAQLARRGSAHAAQALAKIVGNGWLWRQCLDALEAAGGPALVERVVPVESVRRLAATAEADELAAAVAQVAAPWTRWAAAVDALRPMVDGRPSEEASARPMSGQMAWILPRVRLDPPPDLHGRETTAALLMLSSLQSARHIVAALDRRRDVKTTADLLRAAAEAPVEQRRVALIALGKRGVVDLVDEAERFLRADADDPASRPGKSRLRTAYLQYLEQLPAEEMLTRARRWFDEPWPLSLAAEHILARHATDDDRPMLEAAGAKALAEENMYRLCSIVSALAVIGAPESLELLGTIYEEVAYSYARGRVVRELIRHVDRADARALVAEALWDCEEESRLLACRALRPDGEAVEARLREMAADVFEDDEVRASAAGALSG